MPDFSSPVVIVVSGGVVQDVFADNGGGEAFVVDWDTEGCAAEEHGIVAIPDNHGGQQLAAVMCHSVVPLSHLEGTDTGNVLLAAGRAEVLTVDVPQTQPSGGPQLTDRELATVLAALRHWQRTVPAKGKQPADGGYPHFDEHNPLSADEIDDLCQRLNFGDVPVSGCSEVLREVPPPAQLVAFIEDLVRLLYGDRNLGRLTGEITLSEHSGADFLDALNHLLSSRGIELRWEQPTKGEDDV
jgi:hypothetical protein